MNTEFDTTDVYRRLDEIFGPTETDETELDQLASNESPSIDRLNFELEISTEGQHQKKLVKLQLLVDRNNPIKGIGLTENIGDVVTVHIPIRSNADDTDSRVVTSSVKNDVDAEYSALIDKIAQSNEVLSLEFPSSIQIQPKMGGVTQTTTNSLQNSSLKTS